MQKPQAALPAAQSFRIQTFYNDILMEYQLRLQKQQKNGKIPPNKSEDIIKRIKQTIKDYGYLLQDSYRSLIKQEDKQKFERQERQRKQQEQQQQKNQQTKLQVKKEQNSDQEDDFALFERQQANKNNEVKQVEAKIALGAEQLPPPKEEDNQISENIIQQVVQKDELMNKLRTYSNANLDICLQGIFISSKKKYIAKSQKTKLTLDNAFVKVKDRQFYYKSIECELITVKLDDIIRDYKLSL